MDLKSGYPFWALKNGLMASFPRLEADIRCDVAVVGGGITGALIAQELAAHGHEVAVIEQRDIGWGSTAASTALLQYEIDTHMTDLAERYGEDAAVLAYRACAEAIPQLQALAEQVGDVDFARMRSLYYASRLWHVPALRAEHALRARHGFEVEWLDRTRLRREWGLSSGGAILGALAARIDPYRMTYRLLEGLREDGHAIHDRTQVVDIEARPRQVRLRTDRGATVVAGHVVLAAGYANQQWLQAKVAENRSSYAFITDPVPDFAPEGLRDTMVWESARPYLYMRRTGDGRILVGGEDDRIDIPARRDRQVERKARKLRKQLQRCFPDLDVIPAFSWAGTFAETEDGLPFFGAHAERGPRVLFAMAYGGNGITYSMIGASLIRCLIERRRHPLQTLFSFARTG